MGPTFLGIWYAGLAGLLFLPHLLMRKMGRWRKNQPHQTVPTSISRWRPGRIQLVFATGFVVTASVTVLLLAHISKGPDGLLHVHFFNVGQGDSILIVTPNGRQMLVDGGPEAQSATRALSSVLSPLDRGLDLVALTHIDADHSLGLLQVLDRYRVQQALMGSSAGESAIAARWHSSLEDSDIRPVALSAGYQIEMEPGLVIQVLNPPPQDANVSFTKTNNSGLVLRLVYGEVSLLLAADIEEKTERYLLNTASVLNSDVLKVAHHGSKTSTSEAFLRKVNPAVAIISAGAENRFGHPHDGVMDRLRQAVDEKYIFRTDYHGDTEVITDGSGIWVKTQNEVP